MFSSATTPSYVRPLLIASAVVGAAFETRQAFRRRRDAAEAAWGNELVFRLGVGAGALSAALLAHVARVPIGPIADRFWPGLALVWAGIGLRWWSFRSLGQYFTFVVQTSADQTVVSRGPYRVVRHPGYAAILLVTVGIGTLVGNWWSLLSLTAAITATLVFRIRVEERALVAAVGSRYADYAASRKRLVPFVW